MRELVKIGEEGRLAVCIITGEDTGDLLKVFRLCRATIFAFQRENFTVQPSLEIIVELVEGVELRVATEDIAALHARLAQAPIGQMSRSLK